VDATLAKFDQRCAVCDEDIVSGRGRIVSVAGDWAHEQCAVDFAELDEDLERERVGYQ